MTSDRRRRVRLRWTWLLPAIAAANAAMWAIALATSSAPFNPRQALAEFFSTTAIIVFSTNLMLVTRARPLERGFGGLDRLYASHRADGTIGAFIIASHFLIVPKTVGPFPSKPFGYTALAWVLITVFIAVAPRAPWRKLVPLPYHQWKLLHRFNGVLVALAATHSLLAPTLVKRTPLLAIWVYGIVGIGLVCYLYREFVFPRVGPFREFRVSAVDALPDSVTELRLEPVGGGLARRAGQFAFISLTDGPSKEQHPFTISSPAEHPARFSVKSSGDWTSALAKRPPSFGTRARLEGPYGCFDYRAGNARQLWLAGGVGITPFAAMLPGVKDAYSVLLVWSVREAGDAFYREELEAAAAGRPNLRVIVHPTSTLGHLQIAELDLEDLGVGTSAFICGPLPMRRAFIEQLKALGMPAREIFFEEFTLR